MSSQDCSYFFVNARARLSRGLNKATEARGLFKELLLSRLHELAVTTKDVSNLATHQHWDQTITYFTGSLINSCKVKENKVWCTDLIEPYVCAYLREKVCISLSVMITHDMFYLLSLFHRSRLPTAKVSILNRCRRRPSKAGP